MKHRWLSGLCAIMAVVMMFRDEWLGVVAWCAWGLSHINAADIEELKRGKP